MRRILLVALMSCGCSSSSSEAAPEDAALDSAIADSSSGDTATDTGMSPGMDVLIEEEPSFDSSMTSHRGFPEVAPWVSFYGTAAEMGSLEKVAATFRVINIDADPDGANFTTTQIATLGVGKNSVISYLNVGSCENYRSYWDTVPTGFVSCKANTKAQRGAYDGYPDETWMDVGDADYQKLIVEYVAPRLMAMGVDGFFLDNLEIIEHGTSTTNGPCNAACAQGGLDLVRKLREKFPDALIVMQNATSDVTRKGKTGGLDFPSLLDGISHEEVYAPSFDSSSETELTAWKGMSLSPGGKNFFIGTEDYVGNCSANAKAQSAYDKSRAKGFSPYATDESAGQKVVCYWPF